MDIVSFLRLMPLPPRFLLVVLPVARQLYSSFLFYLMI